MWMCYRRRHDGTFFLYLSLFQKENGWGMVFTGAGACVSFLNLDLVCVCGRGKEKMAHTHTPRQKKNNTHLEVIQ